MLKPKCVVMGTGSIGQRHLAVLKSSGAVVPIAFPVRARRRSELAAAGYLVIGNWGEAVAAGAECAIIATDTRWHKRDIAGALNAGLIVLAEKPMAINTVSACSCLEMAKAAKKGLWVGCYYRFHKALNNFRANLRKLGKIHSVRVECQSYLPAWRPDRPYRESYSASPEEGGVLRDLIHDIDYAAWLFGWPAAVQAIVQSKRRLGINAEESADLLWETANGTVVSIRLDYLSRPDRRFMMACGERGTMKWDGFAGTVKMESVGKPVRVLRFAQPRNALILEQDIAFIKALRGKCDPRLATAEDGVRALAVCDAARRASKSRGEEKVKYL